MEELPVTFDERGVRFRWKDYRSRGGLRFTTMTLSTEEFMRRFLLHVLPSGFHRIRHYGVLANVGRRDHLATIRQLLHVHAEEPSESIELSAPEALPTPVGPLFLCPHCGAVMSVIETWLPGQLIRAPPSIRETP